MKKPSIKTCRRLCQLLIIVMFIVIPILNKNRYSLLYGNLLSFHFWVIPLADPLAVLQLTLKNLSITFDSFVGAFISLFVAFSLGTVFCSWMCPFGFLSELAVNSSKKILPRSYKGFALVAPGFKLKFSIFIAGIGFFLIFSTTPVLNQLSLPAWYTRFFQYLFGQDYFSLSILVIAALLLIEFIAKKRIWCRYICPQSVLLSLTKRLNKKRLIVGFNPQKCRCKGEREHCTESCSLSLKPKKVWNLEDMECTNCGDCIVACKQVGKALTFQMGGEKCDSQEEPL